MEANLKFNLPEDRDSYDFAIKGVDWALVALDMSNRIREYLKYGHEFKSADEAVEKIRDEFYEICNNHNVNVDSIP